MRCMRYDAIFFVQNHVACLQIDACGHRIASDRMHRIRHGDQKIAQFYARQTKIFGGGTKRSMSLFGALFRRCEYMYVDAYM